MKERTISISEAQNKITQLPEQFADEPEAVTVTRHGKPVMAILPFTKYQSLLEELETLVEKVEALEETMEILQDEELMTAFREGVEALEKGETVAWEDVKRELGLVQPGRNSAGRYESDRMEGKTRRRSQLSCPTYKRVRST